MYSPNAEAVIWADGFWGKWHKVSKDTMVLNMFEIYKNVINGAYEFHDMMLQRLIQLAGPETTFVGVIYEVTNLGDATATGPRSMRRCMGSPDLDAR